MATRQSIRRTMGLVRHAAGAPQRSIIMAEWIGGLLSGLPCDCDNFGNMLLWSDLHLAFEPGTAGDPGLAI